MAHDYRLPVIVTERNSIRDCSSIPVIIGRRSVYHPHRKCRSVRICAYIHRLLTSLATSSRHLRCSDASTYREHQSIDGMSIYQIVSYRLPKCQFFRYIFRPNVCFRWCFLKSKYGFVLLY